MSRSPSVIQGLLLGLSTLAALSASAQSLDVDFRYKPAWWNTAISLPDDWQKTLVSDTGAVLYDYPGPHQKFKTVVLAGIAAGDMKATSQRLLDPRTPIVLTTSEAQGVTLKQEAFAIADSPFKPTTARAKPRLYRVGRENTQVEWATPPAGIDPSFQHVATGQQQPIRYKFDLEVGGARTIAVGLIEAHWKVPGKRILEVAVEGAPARQFDTVRIVGFNRPFVGEFDGRDVNNDGRIDIEVRAAAHSPVKDTVLSAIWVFPAGEKPNGNTVAAGKLNHVAEAYISCGEDPNLHTFAPRRDVIHLEYQGSNFQPVVRIKTTRTVTIDKRTGVVSLNGRPFLMSQPAPLQAQIGATDTTLVYQPSLTTIDIVMVTGPELPASAFQPINFAFERTRAMDYWQNLSLPWNKISVPDSGIQSLLDSSVRNIFQAREIKGGKPEFRVGPTIYRDMWLVDGSFLLETAAQLGVAKEARVAIERILDYQEPSGQIVVLQPDFYKETGIVLWMLQRHARLTQDKAWLSSHWARVQKGVQWIKAIRKEASRDPRAPYAGLMPPGHPDGGIAGPVAEYTNVYWTLTGLKAAIDAAHWLGQKNDAVEFQREYDDLMATFQRAANRDMRTDAKGNRYLPILMNPGPNDLAQKGQWAFCQAIFPGKVLAQNDPIATGTLAMLDDVNVQGLVLSTGWMTGGIWTYFGSFYGHAHLWMGNTKKAQEILYAFANHASPLLVWREEQRPVGQGSQMVGDMPHNWASAEFIRLVRHMIALERGDRLVMFEGIPAKWLEAGKEIRLDGIATEFGQLRLRAGVAANGRTATIKIDAIGAAGEAGAPIIDLRVFKASGFKDAVGAPLADEFVGTWGKAIELTLTR